MIQIIDYFCSNTKEILYCRNHFSQIQEKDGNLVLTPYQIGDNIPDDASPLERRLEFIHEVSQYYECSVRDNKLLVRALDEIEKCLESGQWDFTRGFLVEILPFHGQTLSKEYIISSLTVLYMLFQCYKVIVWDEKKLPAPYDKMIDDEIKYSDAPHHTLVERCRDYVCYATSLFVDSNITTQIHTDGYTFQEVLQSATLYDALFYQMLLHIAAGKEGLNGYSIAECKSCHQTFKKKHGNQKFCQVCSQNSERVRAYKARKKEESAHAPQIHP